MYLSSLSTSCSAFPLYFPTIQQGIKRVWRDIGEIIQRIFECLSQAFKKITSQMSAYWRWTVSSFASPPQLDLSRPRAIVPPSPYRSFLTPLTKPIDTLRAEARRQVDQDYACRYVEFTPQVAQAVIDLLDEAILDPFFRQNPALYMQRWKDRRGWTEEFRLVEDSAFEILTRLTREP
ncbi:hypothetical protein [Candidatus Protochlamydia phocaeensis]|uniref:hypothetical protein n=1 Tax=Candidatus Protochlamydia phocaeensis TaxID=1414722 RepID=UPI0008382F61|nr:hypothetical protein [Candidatus Protochlamydia phocaeensis]